MSVGSNICRLRKEAGLTIKDISIMSGVTPSLISQIENDKANPSLSTLQAITKALNVDIVSIFDGLVNKSKSPVVRVTDRALCYNFNNWANYLLTNVNPDKFSVSYNVIQPGASSDKSPEMNPKNATGYEFCYVVTGKLHVALEGQVYILNAGDSVCFEAHKKHTVSNPSNNVAEAIWVIVP